MRKEYIPIAHESPGESKAERPIVGTSRRWYSMLDGQRPCREPLLYSHEKTIRHPLRPRKVLRLVTGVVFLWLSALLVSRLSHFQTIFSTNVLNVQDATELIKTFPSTLSIRSFFHYYASEPHVAGSPESRRQAEWTRDKLISFGIDNVSIETYFPWINTPKVRHLAIVEGPTDLLFEASLREEPVPEDPSTLRHDMTPAFHGYSADGNVTGPVVYVNYGRLTDFQYLSARGVNFTDTVALIRHGLIARGLKVANAESFGCVGVLLYSDPMDDGPFNKGTDQDEASYPNGPWRSESSVERGTVQYMSILPGDPLTPGHAAVENATRLAPNETYSVPHIPSLPISWSDALPLFKATEGYGLPADADWLGGLCQINYFSGPSVAKVNLVNINQYEIKPVWNVMGRIQGTEEPDKLVILGTHRDAWGFGGADASAGSAVLLELARVFGLLMERGWRPRRTILLASWDAQEYGMVGSTEWVEEHQQWLADNAVAYVNVDQAVTGPHLNVEASPLLYNLIYEATKDIIDPHTSLSLYDAWKLHHQAVASQNHDHHADEPLPQRPSAGADISRLIKPLGGGSDYMAFFDHVGITSLSMRFEGNYGVYHSNYDSIYWMEHFGDPTFEYHQTLVKLWGVIGLRLADDILLPFSPGEYARELSDHVASLAEEQGCSPLAKLSTAASELVRSTDKFESRLYKLKNKLSDKNFNTFKHKHKHKLRSHLALANDRLASFERVFVDPQGLPGREWFKHIVYAPGLHDGYNAVVFPSMVEAIEDGNNPEVIRDLEEHLAQILNSAHDLLRDSVGKLDYEENE